MKYEISESRRRLLRSALALTGLAVVRPPMLLRSMLDDHKLVRVRHSTFVMGQIANVTVLTDSCEQGSAVATAVFQEFRRLERLLSLFDPLSDVGRVNAAAGRASVDTSIEFREILQSGAPFWSESMGAFDMTVEPLMRLWGFRGGTRTAKPSDREIAGALDAVGPAHLQIEGPRVGLVKPGAAIDLGGIAVGYALDRAAAIARRLGVASCLIELSGDFVAVGSPPDSPGWTIDLEDPRVAYGIWTSVHLNDRALSTSGNYNSVVVYNAVRYGHIIDPRAGRPPHDSLSVTVIAPTAFEADALSTLLFVSGDDTSRRPGVDIYRLAGG